jgi:hypothetical protein
MDMSSLMIVLALLGQASTAPVEPADAPQAADLDGAIEAADEKPAIESDPPATATLGGADKAPLTPVNNAAEPAEGAMAPTRNVATSAPTADALLEWLAEADTSLDGKRITLVDLLSRVYDRPQQAVVIPAYWKLAAAEYEYRIASDEALRLGQLLPPADATGKHAPEPLLEARLAAGEARLRETELAVLAQQHALADQMRLPASDPLPLTADLPHAGAYRTFFQERYARTAPPRGHLIDRTLPLLHRAIELRAAAVQSAADSAEAATEALHAGQIDLASVAESIAELSRQRRAFTAAVRDYNLDIAEYALAVVPAGLTGAQLVGVLIGPPRSDRRTAPEDNKPANPAGGVNQAGFTAPVNAPTAPLVGSPTLAPQRTNVPPASPPGAIGGTIIGSPQIGMPAAGQRRLGGKPAGTSGRKSRIKSVSPRSSMRSSPDTPWRESRAPKGDRSVRHGVSDLPWPEAGQRYWVAKPPLGITGPQQPDDGAPSETAAPSTVDQGLYSALRDLSPLKRAQELSATLHWHRQATEAEGTETTLLDALIASAGFDRRTVIQAYWRGCEQVAASQVITQEVDLLKTLESVAIKLHTQPGGAEAMLGLRTARLAAQAAAEESLAGVLDAQFSLAQLMRRPLGGAWPWPTTPPHAGGYRLKLQSQNSAVMQTSAVRQVAQSLPLRQEALQCHADAVVAADANRVETMQGLQNGQRGLLESVATIRRMTSEALEFLDTQTQYNTQFADYVVSVAPPGLSDSALAGVLVVSR